MNNINVAINGMGRIGRNVFRLLQEIPDINVLVVNDLADQNVIKHLITYDSIYGRFSGELDTEYCSEKDPEELPWKDFGIDVVVESTGFFRTRNDAAKHIKSGAEKVIISAPSKDADKVIVIGVNSNEYDPNIHDVISLASCTTNCVAPILKVLNDRFAVKHGFLTTIHSYTNDQVVLDVPHSDLRRARAAAINMIPTSTGAASAIGQVIPGLAGKMDGLSIRVPTSAVSIVDLVVDVVLNPVNSDKVNNILHTWVNNKLLGILGVSFEPLVSSDYIGDKRSSIVDALSTQVIDNSIKILSYYDNEMGYSQRIVDMIRLL